jgi:hypothetical protein
MRNPPAGNGPFAFAGVEIACRKPKSGNSTVAEGRLACPNPSAWPVETHLTKLNSIEANSTVGRRKMKRHDDIFSKRQIEPGWNVVQAATLLALAREKKRGSFVIYSALEMRMAIEQLLFFVITMAKEGADAATIEACRKKDGLFRILGEVEPLYSLRCRFGNALSEFYPGIPQIAEWDVRSLKRYYTELSDLCHSQLVVSDMEEDAKYWDKQIALLTEVYEFLAAGMRKGTGVLKIKEQNPLIVRLWEDYSNNKISIDDVRGRFKIIKNTLR